MIDVTLHPAPRMRDVIHEQIRIVGLSLRREALVVAIVLAIVTLRIAVDIVHGTAANWFDSDDWAVIGIVAFLFPFAVWRRERQFGPAFLWTLPVDRRQMALAKVFAGWSWLMAALVLFVTWQLALVLLAGVPGARIVAIGAFTGSTAMYLLGSAVVLGLRHPLRWLLGAASLLVLLGFVEKGLAGGPWAVDALFQSTGLFSAVHDAGGVWRTLPPFAQWAIPTVVWLGGGLTALWLAASRHAEQRRS